MAQVQFNLLPPSKMKAMEAQAGQNVVFGKVMQAVLACAALFVLSLGYTQGVQKAQLASVNKDISSKTAQLEAVPNITTILTVQNQLQAASALNQNKHDSSRIFTYLAKVTPPRASVNSVSLDFIANTLKIDGTADSATTVNAFIDTLKFAQYHAGAAQLAAAFSTVVESNFSINQNNVSYSLTANFAPALFANNLTDASGKSVNPQLVVPNSSTARSNDPGSLFGAGGN